MVTGQKDCDLSKSAALTSLHSTNAFGQVVSNNNGGAQDTNGSNQRLHGGGGGGGNLCDPHSIHQDQVMQISFLNCGASDSEYT